MSDAAMSEPANTFFGYFVHGHRFGFQEKCADSKKWSKLGLNIARCQEVLGSVQISKNL